MAITSQMRTEVSQLYVALFGRAPDGQGLGFWVQQRDAGRSMVDLANTMFITEPARVYYPTFLSNQEIIGSFYRNVLGREADTEGLAFWTAKLNAAGATFGGVITEMIAVVASYTGDNALSKASRDLFVNRVAVAQYYGEHNGTVDGAKAVLAAVTKDAATVTSTKTAIDNGTVPGVNQGQTYTLTVNQDKFVGTTGNDTFLAGGAQDGAGTLIQTLQDVDDLDGGAGLDTLNVTLLGGTTVTPAMRNIETVQVRNASAAAATLSLASATGVTEVVVADTGYSTAIDSIGAVDRLTVRSSAQNVSLSGTAASASTLNITADHYGLPGSVVTTLDLGVNAVAAATTANIKLIASSFSINSTQADKLTTANINVGANQADGRPNVIDFVDSGSTLQNIKVEGTAGDLSLIAEPLTKLKAFDASTFTGNLYSVKVASSNAATITTGAGKDTIDVSGQTAAGSKVNLGAGDDVLKIGGAIGKFDAGLDGGDGTDTFNLTSSAGLTAAVAANIKNFEVLDFSGTTATGTYDMSLLGLPGAQLDEAVGGALAANTNVTLDKVSSAFTLTLASKAGTNGTFDATGSGAGAGSILVKGKDWSGTDNTLTIVANMRDGNKDNGADGGIKAAVQGDVGMDKVVIVANVAAADGGTTPVPGSDYVFNLKLTDALATKDIVIKGDGHVDLTQLSSFAASRIDATENTGGVSIDCSGGNAMNVTGSAGDDTYKASGAGDSLYMGKGRDLVTLNAPAAADVVVYKAATDSQILDVNKDGKFTLGDSSYDEITGFSVTEDKIDVTNLGFSLAQRGLVDVTTKVGATTNLANVVDLFSSVAGDRGIAFTVIDAGGGVSDTYVFIDANKDGDFKAADDIVIKLAGLAGGITATAGISF